ncbi:type I-E CRISPR-associated protein Cas6/Cse3/CasE [Embleya sp. NPDC056575]|uniref:type I-E CRISPR-associated protein Cas6/Cse3/CasE n=1 Tax=unclassified Embleya TaxID=2699296 RepID=UPI003676ECEE
MRWLPDKRNRERERDRDWAYYAVAAHIVAASGIKFGIEGKPDQEDYEAVTNGHVYLSAESIEELADLAAEHPDRRHADDWWHRRAGLAGLKLHTHLSHPLDAAVGRSGKGGATQKVRHHRVRFEGTAEIVDPDALRAAVVGGVGKGRAYGCGLLTIAPLRPTE